MNIQDSVKLTDEEINSAFRTGNNHHRSIANAATEKALKAVGKWLETHKHQIGSSLSQVDCFTDLNWEAFIKALK